MKAGEPLRSLAPDQMAAVVVDPAQRSLFPRLVELIRRLRGCDSPEDYYEFQRLLGGELYRVEERRAQCSHAIKRLRAQEDGSRGLPRTGRRFGSKANRELGIRSPRICTSRSSDSKCRRRACLALFRLRSSHYPRSFPQPVTRAILGKGGFAYELGRVESCWRDSRHFALLPDLTNCLRIADITEFTEDKGALLHEVKASNRVDKKQMERIGATLGALVDVSSGRTGRRKDRQGI